MKGFIGLLVALGLSLGFYYFYLRRVQPAGKGTLPTQVISTTGVEMDLLSIARAERTYFATKGSYASLDELTSSGYLTVSRARAGYTYTVDTTAEGFTVTARYSPPPGDTSGLPYPTLTIDQTMEIHRSQ